MDATTKATIPTIAATGSANMRYARRISGKWPRNAPIIVMHRIPTNRLTAKEIPAIPKVIMMTRGKMPTRLGTELPGPWPVDGAVGFAAFAIRLAYYDLAYDLPCTFRLLHFGPKSGVSRYPSRNLPGALQSSYGSGYRSGNADSGRGGSSDLGFAFAERH